jgi:hypothetical protein
MTDRLLNEVMPCFPFQNLETESRKARQIGIDFMVE